MPSRQQAFSDARGIESPLILKAHGVCALLALREVRIDLGMCVEVIGDHPIDVFQSKSGVPLHDLFGRRTLVEGIDNRIKRYARASNADHAFRICCQRNGSGLNH